MSKCEKQVVTKLNKKLEKYGISREELELKLHSASLYGSTVMKMVHCRNHDVATGKYECPYADVVNNTICCTGHECNYRDNYKNSVVNNSAPFEPIVINEEDLPF